MFTITVDTYCPNSLERLSMTGISWFLTAFHNSLKLWQTRHCICSNQYLIASIMGYKTDRKLKTVYETIASQREANLGSRDQNWEFLTLGEILPWGSLGHGANPLYLKGMLDLPRVIDYLLTALQTRVVMSFYCDIWKAKFSFCLFKALIS